MRAARPYRYDVSWSGAGGERVTGLGARHHERFEQSPRHVVLGADRRYTGPDCPPDMLDQRRHPAGRLRAGAVVLSRGWAAWLETPRRRRFELGDRDRRYRSRSAARRAAAPAPLLHSHARRAAARSTCGVTGMPPLLPEWGYGHWKSRDVYEHQRDVEEDFDGYAEHSLPLDAIVIDSPWETQYNTWEFNPHQFPDARG